MSATGLKKCRRHFPSKRVHRCARSDRKFVGFNWETKVSLSFCLFVDLDLESELELLRFSSLPEPESERLSSSEALFLPLLLGLLPGALFLSGPLALFAICLLCLLLAIKPSQDVTFACLCRWEETHKHFAKDIYARTLRRTLTLESDMFTTLMYKMKVMAVARQVCGGCVASIFIKNFILITP